MASKERITKKVRVLGNLGGKNIKMNNYISGDSIRTARGGLFAVLRKNIGEKKKSCNSSGKIWAIGTARPLGSKKHPTAERVQESNFKGMVQMGGRQQGLRRQTRGRKSDAAAEDG